MSCQRGDVVCNLRMFTINWNKFTIKKNQVGNSSWVLPSNFLDAIFLFTYKFIYEPQQIFHYSDILKAPNSLKLCEVFFHLLTIRSAALTVKYFMIFYQQALKFHHHALLFATIVTFHWKLLSGLCCKMCISLLFARCIKNFLRHYWSLL